MKHFKFGSNFRKFIQRNSLAIFLAALFIYEEFIFKIFTDFFSVEGWFFPILFAIITAIIMSASVSVMPRKIQIISINIITSLIVFVFMLQITYIYWFQTAVTVQSAFAGAGKMVGSFAKETLSGIYKAKIPLLLMSLPYSVFVGFGRKFINYEQKFFSVTIRYLYATSVNFIVIIIAMICCGSSVYSPMDLHNNLTSMDMCINKLGVIAATCADIRTTVFPSKKSAVVVEQITDESILEKTEPVQEVTEEETEETLEYEQNVMDIDFAALAKTEEDSNIADLHSYFARQTPTYKNEYTGMFEGYNLIVLTCEGFSPMAIDENLTPTLYKLANSGFVFNNFYTPIWNVSTSDGEYAHLMGLYPKQGVWSFERSANNDVMFCLGNVFGDLGYSANAYHDHDYTYYGRDKSHPNMGYDYKGVGNGLDIEVTWPESDIEMMEKTVDEYINNDNFLAYYMTVSGHLEYNFGGNYIAQKNKEAVADLDLPDACKAYLACNIELDKAMEYLLDRLEQAGKLDNTVIVMTADHYPYGLENDEISALLGHEVETNFEIYKNELIIWNSQMETVEVDKYCATVDILPTVLNLFGCEYDSRLLSGKDILSTAAGFVYFNNGSFISESCMYNAESHEIIQLTDEPVDMDYAAAVQTIANNRRNVAASILTYDYYSYIDPKNN